MSKIDNIITKGKIHYLWNKHESFRDYVSKYTFGNKKESFKNIIENYPVDFINFGTRLLNFIEEWEI